MAKKKQQEQLACISARKFKRLPEENYLDPGETYNVLNYVENLEGEFTINTDNNTQQSCFKVFSEDLQWNLEDDRQDFVIDEP